MFDKKIYKFIKKEARISMLLKFVETLNSKIKS